MIKISLFTILVSFILSSCSNSNAVEHGKKTANKLDLNSVITDTLTYLQPKEYLAKVLTEGAFHEDEVWENAENENWYGLFQGKNNFYLQQTTVRTSRILDPVMDGDDGPKTGWKVTSTNQDTSLILITRLNFLKNRKVDPFKLPKEDILPGEKLELNYKGHSYQLYATGHKHKEASKSDWYIVSDYKLFFLTFRNGKEVKQVLVQHAAFDDDMVNIIFAGDIDGDGLLDFIIDKSNHYNAVIPTLYLSRPAEKGKLVEEVGEHVSVGC
ncbi:hypothetical protein [Adhaeribacter pallidiroseus]|uniref:Uncharacterized protein n=1 Tax=Adhaeribacter pallidiroseus TaxID=2072847 RepID=A0A369QSK6_9BACT|nr:hypothetical protein [Adhaeribacter pallidiroseus]RDC66316.1 hypothetical protein AHMF7616_04947 [Adhaeribacter pallidiroseus]